MDVNARDRTGRLSGEVNILEELPLEVARSVLGALPGLVIVLRVSPEGEVVLDSANQEAVGLLRSGYAVEADLCRLVEAHLDASGPAIDLALSDGRILELQILELPSPPSTNRLTLCVGREVSSERAVAGAAEVLSAELQRSNDDLQEFAYVASHDLSEPLRMVSSFVELLSKRYTGAIDARADEYLRFAVEGAHRMRALIDDLLAVAAVRTAAPKTSPVDLERTVADVLVDLGGLAGESGATVTVGRLPMVVGDPTQLRQVLQNLLANSMKFRSGPTVRIDVAAEVVNGRCRVAIEDDGIGIAPQHRLRAFQMFARLNSRSAFPGNGMGLAMAHRIIDGHGGGIWIEPSASGGSRVLFTLPLAPSTVPRNS